MCCIAASIIYVNSADVCDAGKCLGANLWQQLFCAMTGQRYSGTQFWAHNNVWNKANLLNGANYTQTISIRY